MKENLCSTHVRFLQNFYSVEMTKECEGKAIGPDNALQT
jgi:hypothetical protein